MLLLGVPLLCHEVPPQKIESLDSVGAFLIDIMMTPVVLAPNTADAKCLQQIEKQMEKIAIMEAH